MKLDYKFTGWNRNDATNTDKIWFAINLTPDVNWAHEHTFVTVWGRRGARLQHKIVKCNGREMSKLIDAKWNKGYRPMMDYPEFEELKAELEKIIAWAMLKV